MAPPKLSRIEREYYSEHELTPEMRETLMLQAIERWDAREPSLKNTRLRELQRRYGLPERDLVDQKRHSDRRRIA